MRAALSRGYPERSRKNTYKRRNNLMPTVPWYSVNANFVNRLRENSAYSNASLSTILVMTGY